MFGLYKDPFRDGRNQIFEPPTMAQTYKGILREHSFGRINRVIENCTFEDSSSVYERIFLDCTERVTIVARGVKRQILDREGVLNAATEFFRRPNAACDIHLPARTAEEVENLYSTEFMRLAADSRSQSNRFSVHFYNVSKADFIPELPSVTFGDNRMYRKRVLQTDDQYSVNANADVNFNDPETVEQWRARVFAELDKTEKFAG